MTTLALPVSRQLDVLAGALAPTLGGGDHAAARERLVGLAAAAPLAAAGGVPVSLIAASAFGVDLRMLALVVLAPIIAGLLVRMPVHRPTRRLAAQAAAAGVLATLLYDLCRGGFSWTGLMDHDPIPHIGTALGLDPAWAAGYA